ncbi:MAG: hypothetical protein Q7O12_05535 [Deltaproteobacteria bacterium]|nr:hypothetical protein [Deltaproteobacteria bacterium]
MKGFEKLPRGGGGKANRRKPPCLCLLLCWLLLPIWSVQAKETRRVQEITGQVELKESPTYYTLPNLQKGQTLYVLMEGTSNSLDPFASP